MFPVLITTSQLTTAAADEVFSNIRGDTYRGDVSFLSAARALLYDRLPEGKSAEIHYRTERVPIEYIDTEHMDSLWQRLTGGANPESENQVWVASLQNTEESKREEYLEKFKAMPAVYDMKIEPAVGAALDKLMKCCCYIDFDRSNTLIVLMDNMSAFKWHALASIIPRFFKRHFDAKPLTKEEYENIVQGLFKEQTPDKFNDAIQEFSKRFDFRGPLIRKKLKGFENQYADAQLRRIDREQRETMKRIKELNDNYANMLRTQKALEDRRAQLTLGIGQEEDVVMNYFLSNTNLLLQDTDDGALIFWAQTPFANYDVDMMEQVLASPNRGSRSCLYTEGPSSVSVEDRDMMYRALMVDQKIRLWMCGEFRLSMSDDRAVYAYDGFTRPAELSDVLPNPHLYYNACMGENQRYAIEAVMAGDYINAIDQCAAAAASVNLNESITAGPWTSLLFDPQYGRVFETSDGRRMNVTDVMKYLKEEVYA